MKTNDMKRAWLPGLLAALALTLGACDLDQFPQDRLVPENSFKSETDLQYYLNGLQPILSSGVEGDALEKADNGYTLSLPDYMTGNRSATNSAGSWNWENLRKINLFLQYSSNCPDEAVRLKYDAVAYCLRAAFYYEKLKTFGGVPWYDKVLEDNDPDLYKPRDSRDMIAEKILEDLARAMDAPAEKRLNTVTRWTALALKSRFSLFEGTYRKYHGLPDAEKYLNECVAASELLMASGKYGIDMGEGPTVAYRDLFAQPATDNASMTEVILARSYDQTLAIRHGVNYNIANSRYGMNKALIDSYLMADGSRFTDRAGHDTMSVVNVCTGRDPRLAQTIRTPKYKRVGATADKVGNMQLAMRAARGYMSLKYVQSEEHDASKTNTNDLIAFRYGEVLLNYAEAKAELGTLRQEDLTASIKLLRDRVGMPALDMAAANADPDPFLSDQYPLVTGPNKGVILEIRRERRIELVMEGLRYDDLMRWKAGHLLTRKFKGAYVPQVTTWRGYSLKTMATGDWGGGGKTANFYFYTEGNKPAKATDNNSLMIGGDAWLDQGDHGNLYIKSHPPQSWNEQRDYLAPLPAQAIILNPNLEQNPYWDIPQP